MKKLLSLLLLITFSAIIYSCQDEFCLDATTPALTIRFYDKDTIANTKSISLIVWANDMDTLYDGTTSTDSLSIPLDTQNNSVTYHLSIVESDEDEEQDTEDEQVSSEEDNSNQEDITITYTTEDLFVSKACGYKSIFNDVTINSTTNNWIDSFIVTTTEITNETEAHVKIYY